MTRDELLDKIRAEIMQLDYDTDYVDYDSNDMPQTETVHTICREEVLQIIDKYKAEKEQRRIKNMYDIYRCKKCGNHDFYMKKVSLYDQYGIYCTECGAWHKWGNKEEVQLFAKLKKLIFS